MGEGDANEEVDANEETEEGAETEGEAEEGEDEEGDADDGEAEEAKDMNDSQNSMDDLADELVDKLTDKLFEQALILGAPLQDSDEEYDDQEESMLDQVLGLRGGMKAMKAMKAMKKKSASKIAKGRLAKALVFRGTKAKTTGGLTKSDLVKTKAGAIVSKKQQARGKALYAKYGNKWASAVQKARKALGSKGFVAIKKGSPLYTKAKGFYR